jgi:hypothetical protein
MKDSLVIMQEMVKAGIKLKMDLSIMDLGQMMKKMDMEFINFLMAIFMKVILEMV